MKTTISTKQSEVNKKWILIDASNLVVGRLAAFVVIDFVENIYLHIHLM